MIKTATLPLRGTRTNALVLPITFRGPNLTGAVLSGVVLQNWDNNPAHPEISLPNGVGAGVTGLHLVGSATVDGVIETSYELTIAAADMAALPLPAELGTDLEYVWCLDVTPPGGVEQRYLEGPFIIGGSAAGTGAVDGAIVTIDDQDVLVSIEGIDLVAQFVQTAVDAADTAQNWAEGTGAPGGAGTKSAKGWVNSLLADAGFIAVAADMVLGTGSKIAAVAADLLLGAASKIAIVAADLALGASSLIAQAPASAAAAAISATAAAASAASVPAGAGILLVGTGLPANNLGTTGAYYYDQSSGLTYGPKSATAWPLGAVADVNAGWSHYDLTSNAAYPSTLMPITRANPATALATNLCYHDAPGSAYQTFSAGQPIRRADLGTMWMPQSRNVFLNSTAPVDQPSIAVPVAKVIVWAHFAPGVTVTTAANGAVGTGFGPLTSGVPQVLNITTAGNISVTHSGAGTWNVCQVEYNPNVSFMQNSIATPLIITAGTAVTRDWDYSQTAGALLAAFQASAGSFVFEISRIETQTGFGRNPGLVGFSAGSSSVAINGTASMAYRGAAVSTTMANQAWNTGAGSSQKLGFAWSAGSSTFGAGDIIPVADAVAFNNGTAVAAATIGGLASGQQCLGGWIKRIKWRTANDRVSDRALFDQYTATPIPSYANSAAKLYRQALPGNALPNAKTGVAAVRANTRDSIFLFPGTSHTAGVEPGTDPHRNSMPAKVAARLTSQYGIPARLAGWLCNNNSPPNAGASVYYPERITYSAGWSPYGVTLGGAPPKTSTSGATVTDAAPGTTDTYHFLYWTFPGYGSWTFTDGNGHSKTAAGETAYTATIATTTMTVSAVASGYLQAGDVLVGAAAGTTIIKQLTGPAGGAGTYQVSISQTVSTPTTIKSIGARAATLGPADGVVRGSNTFTYTSNDALPKTLIGGLERDSLSRSVLCINGGTTLRTAVTLALDAMNAGAAENSVLAVIRLLGTLVGIDFLHLEAVTNDASGGTDETIYTSSIQTIVAQALVFGDVMVSGDPPTAPGTIPQATQDRFNWLLYKAAYAFGVTINAMPDVLGPRLKWANMGFYKSDGTHFSGSGVLTGNGDIFGNIVADFIGANV